MFFNLGITSGSTWFASSSPKSSSSSSPRISFRSLSKNSEINSGISSIFFPGIRASVPIIAKDSLAVLSKLFKLYIQEFHLQLLLCFFFGKYPIESLNKLLPEFLHGFPLKFHHGGIRNFWQGLLQRFLLEFFFGFHGILQGFSEEFLQRVSHKFLLVVLPGISFRGLRGFFGFPLVNTLRIPDFKGFYQELACK